MLAFVTSLRHPDNSDDYEQVEFLLQQTLRSIEQQSDNQHFTIVVGNRPPAFALPAKTSYLQVDFEPPPRLNGRHADREGFIRDKGTKIGAGLIAARKYLPDLVMVFDADDFVHREITRFVHTHTSRHGWVVTAGWKYSYNMNGYAPQDQFNQVCGTSFVLPFEVYKVPPNLRIDASQADLLQAYGEILPNLMGAHRNTLAWLRQRQQEPTPIPFRAAVYALDTGENHSRNAVSGPIRPWNRELERSFAIAPSRGRIKTVHIALLAWARARWIKPLRSALARALHDFPWVVR